VSPGASSKIRIDSPVVRPGEVARRRGRVREGSVRPRSGEVQQAQAYRGTSSMLIVPRRRYGVSVACAHRRRSGISKPRPRTRRRSLLRQSGPAQRSMSGQADRTFSERQGNADRSECFRFPDAAKSGKSNPGDRRGSKPLRFLNPKQHDIHGEPHESSELTQTKRLRAAAPTRCRLRKTKSFLTS